MLTPFNILAHKLFKDVFQPNFKTLYSYPFHELVFVSNKRSIIHNRDCIQMMLRPQDLLRYTMRELQMLT